MLTWRCRLVPRWLSCWGIWANILSMVASCLVFFEALEIISTAYILLNSATALHEIVFAVQLIHQGT
ncbi:DUF4386 family protein [Sphingobacterium thalpophilum]|uniref:DUF4386 family protein n=1 Tax=Sphingobacterium thalpophilum TaxID=259 RepID=A0ABV4HBL3_9SPHI